MTLRSSFLEQAAVELSEAAGDLSQSYDTREKSWLELESLSDAASFQAGFQQLSSFNMPSVAVAEQMQRVASTLLDTADALRLIERYVSFLENLSDQSQAVSFLLRYLGNLGNLLDFMCAREISALCTAISPPPLKYLDSFAGLSAAEIHEFHLLHAPPAIQQLAHDNPDMQILEAGDGNLVAAFGDIDNAATVTTIVAGVGSSQPEQRPAYLGRARTIQATTGGATIMWLGYSAPPTLAHGLARAPAAAAANKLQDFQTALRTRNPQQRQVLLGYSYGSTVVGAAAGILEEDAVVLVGSPGVGSGVFHASDLGEEVYAITGSTDPIGFAATQYDGVHGIDPTSPSFGATVLPSQADHSGYWEDEKFLQQLREVVAGNAKKPPP